MVEDDSHPAFDDIMVRWRTASVSGNEGVSSGSHRPCIKGKGTLILHPFAHPYEGGLYPSRAQ